MIAPFLRTWLPGLTPDLRPFERHNLIAGLTVTAYLVPQVMAYAILAGLSPVTGLWAAMVALPLYALLGTSRWLSFGPESSVAVMTAAVIVPAVAAGGTTPAQTASALALAVGLVGVLASLLRMSFVADLLGAFGVTGSVSQRAEPMLRAIGVARQLAGSMNLGTVDLLTSQRRRAIIRRRDGGW